MNRDTKKIKNITDLPIVKIRQFLETAAKLAAPDYETDEGLIVFTELDGVAYNQPHDD